MVSHLIAGQEQQENSRQVYQKPKLEQVASATHLFAQAGSVIVKPDFSIDPDFLFLDMPF